MKLIALSGPPAAGKTSIARALGSSLNIPVLYLGASHALQQEEAAYRLLVQQTADHLARGQSVILDSPAQYGWFQGACRELAFTHFIPLYVIYCRFRNEDIQRYRLRVRRHGYPDWIETGSESARRFAAEFAVWDATGLVLDECGSLQDNIQRALHFVSRYDG